jgi:hypothetical protein
VARFSRFAIFALTLFFACASFAATYYIDFSSGSDSNNGTSKTTPWKHAPGMPGFAGSYSHAAGDQFIFKGGTTWPSSSVGMSLTNSGSSGARDYYGVDTTWFSSSCGSSFCRPIFDGGSSTNPGFGIQGSNITIDNIEMRNAHVSGGFCDAVITGIPSITNVTIQNVFINGWSGITAGNDGANSGGMCFNQVGANVKVLNSVIAGTAGNNTGGGIWGSGLSEVGGTTFHDMSNGIVQMGTGALVHDNTFYNIRTSIGGTHENVYEVMTSTKFYNNVIHDTTSAVVVFLCPNDGTLNDLVYNNTMWNMNGIQPIQIDANCGNGSGSGTRIFNNTIECGGTNCVRMNGRTDTLGTLIVQNNHFINGTPVCANQLPSCETVTHLTNSSNTSETLSTANGLGYTPSNQYKPTSGSSPTVGAGMNLANQSITPLDSDRLGVPRPSSGAWDTGSYMFSTSGSAPPAPPTGLSAVVH